MAAQLKNSEEKNRYIDYIYWPEEVYVYSEWGNDGIRKKFPFLVPDGNQICRLISYKKKERPEKGAKVRIKKIVFEEDVDLMVSDQRLRGYNFDLNAIGGNFHDQYSASASAKKILISFVPDSISKKQRSYMGCTVDSDPLPAEDTNSDSEPDGSAKNSICGVLLFDGMSGNSYRYKGVGLGTVNIYFSKNGVITSSIRQVVSKGGIYTFDPKGGSVGFTCRL